MGIDISVVVGYGLVFDREILKDEFQIDDPENHGEFLTSMDMDGNQFFVGTIFEQTPSMRHEPLELMVEVEPKHLESSKEATMEVIDSESYLPSTFLNHLELEDWKFIVYSEYS